MFAFSSRVVQVLTLSFKIYLKARLISFSSLSDAGIHKLQAQRKLVETKIRNYFHFPDVLNKFQNVVKGMMVLIKASRNSFV